MNRIELQMQTTIASVRQVGLLPPAEGEVESSPQRGELEGGEPVREVESFG